MDPDPLALDRETMRDMGYAVVDMLVDRIAALRTGPVLTTETLGAMRERLTARPSETAQDFDGLLRRLDVDVLPWAGSSARPATVGSSGGSRSATSCGSAC